MRKKRCLECGKPLTGKQKKYCSRRCRNQGYYLSYKDRKRKRMREYFNFRRDKAMAKERQPRTPTTELERVRIERGLSRSELSKLSGVSVNAIASYEYGKTKPRADTILKLSRALHLSPWDLFQREFYGDDANFEDDNPLGGFVSETNAKERN